jgi:hypothetical protein
VARKVLRRDTRKDVSSEVWNMVGIDAGGMLYGILLITQGAVILKNLTDTSCHRSSEDTNDPQDLTKLNKLMGDSASLVPFEVDPPGSIECVLAGNDKVTVGGGEARGDDLFSFFALKRV